MRAWTKLQQCVQCLSTPTVLRDKRSRVLDRLHQAW
jgi:hypothetical protein